MHQPIYSQLFLDQGAKTHTRKLTVSLINGADETVSPCVKDLILLLLPLPTLTLYKKSTQDQKKKKSNTGS